MDYLESLQGVTKNQLYKQPSTVLAVFRRMQSHLGKEPMPAYRKALLTYAAKNLVMALLYMGRPIAVTDLDSWVRPDSIKYGKSPSNSP